MSCIEYPADDINKVITSLLRLKCMFGAVIYLANPDGTRRSYPSEDFEAWFYDIRDKLDNTINLLSK
jgi:hypothetical protein